MYTFQIASIFFFFALMTNAVMNTFAAKYLHIFKFLFPPLDCILRNKIMVSKSMHVIFRTLTHIVSLPSKFIPFTFPLKRHFANTRHCHYF